MLLQGLGSTAAGYLVQGAFKYGMWEVFKSALGYSAAVGSAKIAVLVGAAFAAECMASTLLTPFERARIKLVADPSYAEGLLPALSRLLKEDGPLKGLFGDGLLPTLIKMTAYTTAQLTTFTLVSEALAPRGFHSWPGYPIAGQTIDLLVEKNGKPLGIDLIGHPGVYEDAFELEHYRLFRRAGLRLFPLPYSAWHKDRDSCLTAIEQ